MDAILTMGLPAAGKSTAIRARFGDHDYRLIDPDVVKASHPDYDPKNPSVLHAWSKEITAQQLDDALATGADFILDGTGTDGKMLGRITRFQDAGYRVTVLYCRVALETALARNAARERVVPDDVIYAKAEQIDVVADKAVTLADDFIIFDNN